MYDRDSLLAEIAAAIGGQPAGEVTVRWWTQNGQRRVEVTRIAEWDLSGPANVVSGPPQSVEQLRIGSTRTEENAAAVDMYRRSVAAGRTLSERVLAARFGRSKSWAHDRVQEAKTAMKREAFKR